MGDDNGSASRKRLLADPKPKQGCSSSAGAAPSDSPDRKKTRDLPNLSDCHSCGLHINNTNPKDKLQTLDSVWRVVLLCRTCLKRVESAKLCSYCFSEADSDDCHRCRDCDRRVHKDCVLRYKCSPPWSYCCSDLGFSVCIDCWVPKSLENSIRVRKRRRRNKMNVLEPCDSGVSGSCRRLEVVVNDAKRVVDKKSAAAAKAKENAFRKAVVARRAAELANGALELVSKKDENGVNNECSVTSSSSASSFDAELAFLLHRAMNSSPRISRNLCLTNSSCMPLLTVRECGGNTSVRSSGSRASPDSGVSWMIEECPDKKLNESADATVSVSKVYVRRSYGRRRLRFGNLRQCGLVYTRRCKKDEDCGEKGGVVVSNCSLGHKQDIVEYELHPDDASNQNGLNRGGSGIVLNYERWNGKLDRYMLKYSRRPVGLKAISSNETNILDDDSDARGKARALGMGLLLNCSGEYGTLSDASIQSCTVSLQASACAGVSSQDPS